MSKHALAVHVACRPNACYVGLELIVGNDGASFGKNTDVLKADALSHCATADRNEHCISRCALFLAVYLVVYAVLANGCYLCAEKEVYTLLNVVLVKDLGDFGIGGACDMIEHLDNGDL